MKTYVTHGHDSKGRPHTTVQAAHVVNDTLFTASVDAKGGLQAAKDRAVALVLQEIRQHGVQP